MEQAAKTMETAPAEETLKKPDLSKFGLPSASSFDRGELDRLCMERQESDLGIRYRQENGYEFCIESTREEAGVQGMVRYHVQADWQGLRAGHSFALAKEVAVEG